MEFDNNSEFMKRFAALTTKQLRQIYLSLVVTNDNIDELVDELPQVQKLEQERLALLESNVILAQNNMNRRPEMDQIKCKLRSLVDESLEIRKSIENKESRIMDIIPNALQYQDSIHAIILASAAEAEDDSENIARSFLNREFGSYRTFLRLYLEKRKLAHLRRIKADKFLQQSG